MEIFPILEIFHTLKGDKFLSPRIDLHMIDTLLLI